MLVKTLITQVVIITIALITPSLSFKYKQTGKTDAIIDTIMGFRNTSLEYSFKDNLMRGFIIISITICATNVVAS